MHSWADGVTLRVATDADGRARVSGLRPVPRHSLFHGIADIGHTGLPGSFGSRVELGADSRRGRIIVTRLGVGVGYPIHVAEIQNVVMARHR